MQPSTNIRPLFPAIAVCLAICLLVTGILATPPASAHHHGALIHAALDHSTPVQVSEKQDSLNPIDNSSPREAEGYSVAQTFEVALDALKVRNFAEKEKAIVILSKFDDPQTVTVLQTMLEGRLYYRKSDGRVVGVGFVGQGAEEGIVATDMVSGEVLDIANKRKLKKIGINNELRRILRALIAKHMLSNPDPKVRLQSVEQMIKAVSSESVQQIRTLLGSETDQDVIVAARTLIALHDVSSEKQDIRLTAISILAESDRAEVRNRLADLLKKNDQGQYIEADTSVHESAQHAIEKIDDRLSIYEFIETLFFGLSLGSVLLLMAIGLAITFGVIGVINMAHGELMMIGAYTTYIVQQLMPNTMDWSLAVAVPAAFIVAGLFGIVIERTVIRFLYGRVLETLLDEAATRQKRTSTIQ